MNRQKRQRAARLRARREAPAMVKREQQMATVRFALRIHDLFQHGYTFTEAVFRAVGRTP